MMTQGFQFITGLKATLCVCVFVLLRVWGCVCDLKLLLMQ